MDPILTAIVGLILLVGPYLLLEKFVESDALNSIEKFIKESKLTKKFFKPAAIVFGLGFIVVLFSDFLGILALILFLVWLYRYRY